MTIQKRKTFVLCVMSVAALLLLGGRVGYLMIFCSEHYTALATDLHERSGVISKLQGAESLIRRGLSLQTIRQYVPYRSYTVRSKSLTK